MMLGMMKQNVLLLTALWVFCMTACARTMNDVIGREPDFAGIVTEVSEEYILVHVDETEVEYENGPVVKVSLDVEIKDSYTHYVVGDEVFVYYNGNFVDGDPAVVDTVYALTLKKAAVADYILDSQANEKYDLIPMVMVGGVLYLDTGHESTVEVRCGMLDGEITTSVSSSEMPSVDDRSNFGEGFGYQFGSREGTVEIYMNEKWRVFATEEVRHSIQFPEE